MALFKRKKKLSVRDVFEWVALISLEVLIVLRQDLAHGECTAWPRFRRLLHRNTDVACSIFPKYGPCWVPGPPLSPKICSPYLLLCSASHALNESLPVQHQAVVWCLYLHPSVQLLLPWAPQAAPSAAPFPGKAWWWLPRRDRDECTILCHRCAISAPPWLSEPN